MPFGKSFWKITWQSVLLGTIMGACFGGSYAIVIYIGSIAFDLTKQDPSLVGQRLFVLILFLPFAIMGSVVIGIIGAAIGVIGGCVSGSVIGALSGVLAYPFNRKIQCSSFYRSSIVVASAVASFPVVFIWLSVVFPFVLLLVPDTSWNAFVVIPAGLWEILSIAMSIFLARKCIPKEIGATQNV